MAAGVAHIARCPCTAAPSVRESCPKTFLIVPDTLQHKCSPFDAVVRAPWCFSWLRLRIDPHYEAMLTSARSRASMTRDRSALDKLTEARAASSKCA
jgi:hypothetical protein